MPERPTGARLEHTDGTVTPLELVYVGRTDDGMHVWRALTEFGFDDQLMVDKLPPRTKVVLPAPPSAQGWPNG